MGTMMLLGAGPSSPSVWSPLALSGLLAWYDAYVDVFSDSGTTPATDGQSVNQWNDLSGAGYNLTQGLDGNVIYQTTGFNGRPTIAIDGGWGMVTVADSVAMGTGAIGSCFIVGQMLSTTINFGRIISIAGNGQAATGDFGGADGNAAWILRAATSDEVSTYRGDYSGGTAMSVDADHRFGSIFDGTNVTLYVDNVAGTPSAQTRVWNGLSQIWVGTNGVSYSDILVSEMVFTLTALGITERALLDAYFTNKWGL